MIWYFLLSIALGWAMVSRKSALADAERATRIAERFADEVVWLHKKIAKASDLDRLRAEAKARGRQAGFSRADLDRLFADVDEDES